LPFELETNQAANLVVDIEVLNLTEGVICLEKHRNIGAATATTNTGIPESCKKNKLPRCETLRDSSPAGGVSSHQITVNYSHSCPPEAAVSFGNVKETKEPGKSTFSDGETDGESSARIYPSKLTEKKRKSWEIFFNDLLWRTNCIHSAFQYQTSKKYECQFRTSESGKYFSTTNNNKTI